MSRYVLLEFDNDDDAEQFTLSARQDLFGIGKVVGTFQKPTKFCQCTPEERRGTIGARGSKYGWFICGKCKKPPKNGNQVIFNLLENDGRPTWKREICLQVLARYTGKF